MRKGENGERKRAKLWNLNTPVKVFEMTKAFIWFLVSRKYKNIYIEKEVYYIGDLRSIAANLHMYMLGYVQFKWILRFFIFKTLMVLYAAY